MSNLNNTLTEFYEKSKEKRKDLESLVVFLKEWKCQEEFYALGMEKIFIKLVKNQDSAEKLRNFHNLFSVLIEKSKQFCDYLNKEILDFTHKFLVNTTKQARSAYLDGLKAGEVIEGKFIRANEKTSQYFESLTTFERISKKLNIPQKPGSQKKLLKLLAQTHKQVTETFNSYKYTQMKMAVASKKYQQTIARTLLSFSECEFKAQSHYQACLDRIKKSISFKAFAVEEVSNEIFELKAEIHEFPSEFFEVPDTSIEQYMNSRMQALPGNYSVFGGSIIENFQEIVERKSRSSFEEFVEKAWSGERLLDEDFEYFGLQIKENTGRKAFCFCLNGKRNSGEFLMQAEGFILVAQLILEVLNECERAQDLSVTKNLILLSQTFYYTLENGEKTYLQQGIRGHSLWKDMVFWENFIENGIFQEIRKQKLRNFEQNSQVAESNYKSLIFCQLISYGTIMAEFLVNREDSNQLIRKFADKYSFDKTELEGIFQTINITYS